MALIVPISSFAGNILPSELVEPLGEALQNIGLDLEAARLSWTPQGINFHHVIHILGNAEMDFPIIPGSTIQFEPADSFAGIGLNVQIGTQSSVELTDLTFRLTFSPDFLKAYRRNEEGIYEVATPEEEEEPGTEDSGTETGEETDLGFAIDVNFPLLGFDFDGNISFDPPVIGIPYAAMIGDTGLILDFSGEEGAPIEFILSDSNLSHTEILDRQAAEQDETNEGGETEEESEGSSSSEEGPAHNLDLPEGFRGVRINQLRIVYQKPDTHFPPVSFRSVAIGNHGFWGEVYLGTPPGSSTLELSSAGLSALFNEDGQPVSEDAGEVQEEGSSLRHTVYPVNLLGMKAALQYFGIGFKQNLPEWGEIKGFVFMPFADRWVALRASIGGPNGDFMLEVGGVGEENLINLETDFFEITVDSIAYQNKDGINYAIISGGIRLKVPEGMDLPEFEADRISISDRGDIEIEGGWVNMPEALTLDLQGFRISISAFGLGNEGEAPDERQWVGLSGEVALMEGLPIRAAVEGLKISWPKAGPGDIQVSLEGIAVDLTIPGTLSFSGRVSYDRETNLFKGHILLNLISLRMEIEASIMVGKVKDEQGREFSVFYIYLAASLPTSIPLGATGTGLYGVAGLFGYNVSPTKTEEQNWYEWYKTRPEYDVTHLDKWMPAYDNLAFGAGITLGTIYDDGTTINLSAMLVVLIPGPVIMLEGKANLLKPRSDDKTEEGNFYLLAVLDCRAGTFQLNIDIRYSLEDIVNIGGSIEAFFDFNDNQNWYVYIGRKEPESKRIFADILSLFTANTYFMIDPNALQFGASVGININESWGPVTLRIIARISLDAAIFFKPFQLYGRLEFLIDIAITIFGIGLRIELQMLLEGKTPNPFWIYGKARVALGLPFPLPSFETEVEFSWTGGQDTLPVWPLLKEDENEGKKVYMKHHKSSDYSIPLIHSGESSLSDYNNLPVVPVDARPSVTFAKRIHNLKKSNGTPLLTIEPEVVGNGEFEYNIDSLQLHKLTSDSSWLPVRSGINAADLSDVLPFYITNQRNCSSFVNGDDAAEPILELWRTAAMDNRNSYERETYTEENPPCAQNPLNVSMVNWFEEEAGATYDLLFTYKNLFFITDYFTGGNNDTSVPIAPYVGLLFPSTKNSSGKALRIVNFSVHFPSRTMRVAMQIGIGSADTLASYPHYKLIAKIYRGEVLVEQRDFIRREEFYMLEFTSREGFDSIRVEENQTWDKAVWLYQIVYQSMEDYSSYYGSSGDSAPAVTDSAINPDLVLEPGETYRITLGTSVLGRGAASATDYFYFRTDCGPGILTEEEQSSKKNPIHRLPAYIDNSYPVNGATNHYYGYDIGIGFNESYIQKLYKNNLNLRLKDRNGKLIANANDTLLTGLWLSGFLPLVKNGLYAWLSAKAEGGCLRSEPEATFQPLLSFRSPSDLKPSALYFAELFSMDENDQEYILHTFQFATSKYKNFTEHFTGSAEASGEMLAATVHRLPSVLLSSLPAELMSASSSTRDFPLHQKKTNLENEKSVWASTMGYLSKATKQFQVNNLHLENREMLVGCFEQLYAAVLPAFQRVNLDPRPAAPKLEFIRIPVEGTTKSLLLLESPEPVDFDRIRGTVTLSRSSELGFIYNKDQTKAFLRMENIIGFDAGIHTLELTFDGMPDFNSGIYRTDEAGTFLDEQVRLSIEVDSL